MNENKERLFQIKLQQEKEKKVIFMVPRVPLVHQQYEKFKKYLPQYTMKEVVGQKGATERLPLNLLMEYQNIIFMTPQVGRIASDLQELLYYIYIKGVKTTLIP